jgi:hypothetical protein
MAEGALYTFPPAPMPDLTEWPGSPMGVSNTVTRTKTRTAVHNKTVDATPGLLDRLLNSAHGHLNASVGKAPIYQHDVMIHGTRVRATTNSHHLYDFWTDNWYSLDAWQRLTGHAPPPEPRVRVYALHGVKHEDEAAYYSHDTNTIVFFNTSYYGQLKSWVLGAVGRILAAQYGIHSIHGACVEKDGKGVLYIAPTGTGKSTSSYGLMAYPRTRFHSDDWVYVRYTYATREGRRVSLVRAEGSDGSRARGYQVYRWIEQHRNDARAQLTVMTLDNQELSLTLADLDLAKPLEAYAYTSEKVFYLRTNLAESFPLAVCQILAAKEENVPDVSGVFLHQSRDTLRSVLRELRATHDGDLLGTLNRKPDSELAELCGRLIAFDNARSMLDISTVLPPDRIYSNPMGPVRLAAVMLLKRNADDPTVLSHLSLDEFMERLLIGETPDKKRETAYNAYRAVDDKAERALIEGLEKEANASSGTTLYKLFSQADAVPASLAEEFELFRVMYQATCCYGLNTILQNDPRVRDRREAVRRTMALIARTLDEEPKGIHLSIEDYRRYID